MVKENLAYKNRDHLFRAQDEYANAKYDITSDWLASVIARGSQPLIIANVGCGSGEYCLRLATGGARVLACEPERGAFEAACRKCEDYSSIEIQNVGLESFVQSTPVVDALVMHDVLEHLENEEQAVAHISRLMKPGAEAVISVPAFNWLFGYHDVQLGHYRRYTKGRMIELFRKDFQILRTRYYGSLFIPVTLIFSRWLKRGYPEQNGAGTSWKRFAFRMICQFQRRLPEPIGTSVLIHIRKL